MTMTQHITASTAAQQYRHGIMGAGLIGGYLAAHLAPVLSRVIPETSLTVIGRGYSREDYGNEMAISDFADSQQMIAHSLGIRPIADSWVRMRQQPVG